MTTLPTQVVPHAGTSPIYLAAGSADTCATGGGVVLHVLNGGGTARTVTLVNPETVDGLAVANRTVSVGTAAAGEYIPVPDMFKSAANGLASITYDSTTLVTIAVLRVP